MWRAEPLRFFVGFDSREPIAYHVFCHSILRRATVPVSVTPLVQHSLREAGLYTRERGSLESTEFSMTRFLVPFLAGYSGYAIFADCDMLMLADPAELKDEIAKMEIRGDVVSVCQHQYTPSTATKMEGQAQSAYPRKNWSSFMIFNAALCRDLTPEYVSVATGLELHRFQWTEDARIGSLPLEWNWLIGEYRWNNFQAKNLHYTLGGPWFRDYQTCPRADDWRQEYWDLMKPMHTSGAAFSRDAWLDFQERLADAEPRVARG